MDPNPRGSSPRKVVVASLIGTTIEWYDFFLFGVAAALIFNELFFPDFEPLVGTLLAFSTYAIGFVARPIGGIVFGHFGDKVGRKSMLVLSLGIMGAATFCIGLLPCTRRSASPPRSCSWSCASCRASRSAASGAARS